MSELRWEKPGDRSSQECTDRRSRGDCTPALKLHQAGWLLAAGLAKEQGKQDAAVHLC